MARCLRRLAWLPLWMVACSPSRGPALQLVLAHAAVGGRCFVPGGPQAPDERLPGATIGGTPIDRVRLTVRRYLADDPRGQFYCDRVLSVQKSGPSLQIPKGSSQKIDLFAEAFAAARPGEVPQRLATGALLGLAVDATTLPPLRLYPDERFRCVDDRLLRPRAFHSATLLPNGQVLFVGGLVATPEPGSERIGAAPLYLTADIEVWDPTAGRFFAVTETNPAALPRAFHQAVLVGRQPPYTLLLLGGATAAATAPAFGLNTGAVPGPRLVPFDTSGPFITPNRVNAAGAELLRYDPLQRTATRTSLAGFVPAAYAAVAPFPNGAAVAGGIDWLSPSGQAKVVAVLSVSRAPEATPRAAALMTPRMGATLTALSDETALLWGGALDPAAAAGALVHGLGAQGSVGAVPLTLPDAPPTQFHTTTLLPAEASAAGRSLLVSGGFTQTTMNMGQALQPPPTDAAVRILTLSPQGTIASAQASFSGYDSEFRRYRPAGWQSALDLGRGRVLITGGAPRVDGRDNDCDGGSDFYCALAQASLFTTPATLAPTAEPMQLPRYGHTSTLLSSGNVLIVGGIGAPLGQPRLYGDAEMYDPRPVEPVWSEDSGRADPDDPLSGLDSIVRAPGQEVRPCDQL